jgi:hypothetical protein
MYDKFGLILRIETTVNDVSQFKHYREVEPRSGPPTEKIAPMKKNIYSLFPLGGLLKAANRRYLEFISTFDDPSQGIKHLGNVSKTVESDNRTYKGFNFYSADDRNCSKSWRGESLPSTGSTTNPFAGISPTRAAALSPAS